MVTPKHLDVHFKEGKLFKVCNVNKSLARNDLNESEIRAGHFVILAELIADKCNEDASQIRIWNF